jgi:plastocyanin domain-containing protein
VAIPKYGIEKKLVPGDNTIEFTSAGSGVIAYGCGMGMIRTVLDERRIEGRSEGF